MKIKFYFIFLLALSTQTFSQIPEEALRLSWYAPGGSARQQAIGGALVSLGGDASANHVNPAGLAFFKTSDFILSPGWVFGKNKGIFRGTSSTGDSKNGFSLGTSGFVVGGVGRSAKTSFGLTVTRMADFRNLAYYRGENNYSSYGEPLADEFALSGLTIDEALNSSNISLQTRMALYTYLVDTATINGSVQVITRSENPSNRDQQHRIETSGGITEITLGIAEELDKKFMVGFSLGVPIVKLDKATYFREADATGDNNNDFGYLAYAEDLSLTGVGVNLRGGLIYRPKDYIRLGLAVHSPSWFVLKERYNAGLAADLENAFGPGNGYDSVSSSVFTGENVLENKYTQSSPTKVMISGAYVFREVEDITRQKGFITADIEYVNYKWMKFSPYEEGGSSEYFNPYNEAIDAIYKGAFNFRVGGELKFKVLMARAGFSYYGNPYKQSETKGRKMNISGGLGYRDKGVFVDLTYVHRLNREVNFPYRVNAPRANTFADLKENGGTVLLTIGFKI